MGVKSFFRDLINAVKEYLRDRSKEYIEAELRELECVFITVLMASFIGLPSPPMPITLRLLPYLAPELIMAVERSADLADVLGEYAGLFEVT